MPDGLTQSCISAALATNLEHYAQSISGQKEHRVMVDEIHLQPSITYDPKSNALRGFCYEHSGAYSMQLTCVNYAQPSDATIPKCAVRNPPCYV